MINDEIKRLRLQRHLTQDNLAEAFGVSQSTIAAWENGTRKPTIDCIPKIAEFFGVTVDDIIGSDSKTIKNDPAESKLDHQLIELLVDFSPDEIQRILDFAAGIKANRKA